MSTLFPIRLNTIRAEDNTPFDIFVQLPHRFVHYSALGDKMEGGRLRNLKEKGVKKLFIKPEHEDIYLAYLEEGLDELKSTTLSVNDKTAMAHDSLLSAAENAGRNLETEERFNGQKRQLEKISDFLSGQRSAVKSILEVAGVSVDPNEHAAAVSSLAVAVASKSGITDKKIIFELGMAGLLHDIGKARLKFDHNKPLSTMTSAELKEYKKHPQEGSDMLSGKPFVSPRILKLVLCHEERGQGKGYPGKLDLFNEEPSFQILSMVNCFERFSRDKNMPILKAIDSFSETYENDYSEDLISVLSTILA
jgi:HD-GYP domain-containing protein (c-di-GMP phosphodiesterase class II)